MRDFSEHTLQEARDEGWPPGGRMAWDVGANTGMTLPVLTSLYDRVVAFEPAAESFRVLCTDWGQHRQAILVNKAVADIDGTVTLSARADPIASGQLVAPGMRWAWGPELERREVPSVTLDSLMDEYGTPDFVKVDTEGGELRVLRGASRLLAKQATCWTVEFHSLALHDACDAVLAAAGYAVETGRPVRFDEGSREWHDYGWLNARPCA